MKKNKLILCCVETRKRAKTDYVYIEETINHFYKPSSKITYRPVYMKTKTQYKSQNVKDQINEKSIGFDDVSIIYFIDTDNWNSSPEDLKLLEQIKKYCTKNKYDFVFFCKDVENVFWGAKWDNSNKVEAADRFRRKKEIENIDPSNLSSENYQNNSSNILIVLNKYWERKYNIER